jgi:hypothetical protein
MPPDPLENRKKPTGKSATKQPRDENCKDLFAIKDWARNGQ